MNLREAVVLLIKAGVFAGLVLFTVFLALVIFLPCRKRAYLRQLPFMT